jgi:hypothetical protein
MQKSNDIEEANYRDGDNVLLLYTLTKNEFGSQHDVTLNFQVYPGGYDNGAVTIIIDRCASDKLERYHLSQEAPLLPDLEIGENDVITIYVNNNGYVYVGGIWQVGTAPDSELFVLNNICDAGIDLIEVFEVLSVEESGLVEEAISQAETFLKNRFSSCVFLSCREVGENSPEISHQSASIGEDTRSKDHQWQMFWNCFFSKLPWVRCRVLVSYHPQTTGNPFSVEIVEKWTWEP